MGNLYFFLFFYVVNLQAYQPVFLSSHWEIQCIRDWVKGITTRFSRSGISIEALTDVCPHLLQHLFQARQHNKFMEIRRRITLSYFRPRILFDFDPKSCKTKENKSYQVGFAYFLMPTTFFHGRNSPFHSLFWKMIIPRREKKRNKRKKNKQTKRTLAKSQYNTLDCIWIKRQSKYAGQSRILIHPRRIRVPSTSSSYSLCTLICIPCMWKISWYLWTHLSGSLRSITVWGNIGLC